MVRSHSEEAAALSDLIGGGVLRFAAAPPMNFQHLDFPRFTLPLIEHDYPAKTPAMWNSAYVEFGLDARNIVLVGSPSELPAIVGAIRRDARYLGGGAGVGFKEKTLDHLDESDPLVDLVRSINLITKTPAGKLRGHNTDGVGYAIALEEVLRRRGEELGGQTVLLLGAGGTSAAVAFALAGRGAHVVIVNRTLGKAAALAARVGGSCGSYEELSALAASADVIVNMSTVGAAGPLEHFSPLGPAELPVTDENIRRNLDRASEVLTRIQPDTILSDVVIATGGTPFLRQAAERGFEVLDGIPMVIGQAIEAFWILHGRELEPRGISKQNVASVMRQAARSTT